MSPALSMMISSHTFLLSLCAEDVKNVLRYCFSLGTVGDRTITQTSQPTTSCLPPLLERAAWREGWGDGVINIKEAGWWSPSSFSYTACLLSPSPTATYLLGQPRRVVSVSWHFISLRNKLSLFMFLCMGTTGERRREIVLHTHSRPPRTIYGYFSTV